VGTSSANQLPPADELQRQLMVKAKELEDEVNTYRQENAALKQTRKQQEQALAETLQQKSEVKKYWSSVATSSKAKIIIITLRLLAFLNNVAHRFVCIRFVLFVGVEVGCGGEAEDGSMV
jgi:predicted Holliday junction resolvase-like endonuclease